MGKFFLGLVTGVFLVILAVVLLFFAALKYHGGPPRVSDNSALIVRLSGDVPEKPSLELPAFLGRAEGTVTVSAIWSSLKKAAADPRIKAVVLEPEGISAGWAKLDEIRSDLEQFRKSGKPVIAYLRTPGTREYYLALAADRICLGPEDPLMLKGVRAEMMFFKGTLDKLGVAVQVEHAGKYKDFGDMFTRTSMSPETREMVTGIADDVYSNLVAHIAARRKKTPDDVRALIDRGPFTATQALNAGLVDALRFEDQVFGELKTSARISLEKYIRAQTENSGAKQVALVVAEGDIVRGDAGDTGDEPSLTSYGFDKLLNRVANDSAVKAIIVRIDSPGGEVTASDDMWRQMNLAAKKKPMVISMSDLAASGGYYMAMNGAPIVAYPLTETGSIGVVFGKPDLRGLFNKIGVTQDWIQRGRHADIDSAYTALTPEEQQILRVGIDESYRDFLTKVADARRIPISQVEPVAEGRVWLGNQVKPRLVDELGGLDTAVALAKKKAGIPAGEQVDLVTYPKAQSLLDFLLRRTSPDDAVESRLAPVFGRIPHRAWMRGGFLRIMPNVITVR